MAESNDLKPERNPVEWVVLTVSEVKVHRNINCPHYEKCLLQVSREMWKGFTCSRCDYRTTRSRNDQFQHSWGTKEVSKRWTRRS